MSKQRIQAAGAEVLCLMLTQHMNLGLAAESPLHWLIEIQLWKAMLRKM